MTSGTRARAGSRARDRTVTLLLASVALALAVGVGVTVGTGVTLGDALGLTLAVGLGDGSVAEQAPGPGLLLMNPETVPLKGDDAVVPSGANVDPVVFTTTSKSFPAGTVNE